MSNVSIPTNGPSLKVAATLRDPRRAGAAICNPPSIGELLAARGVR